jgi:hypothetical protein
VLKWSEFFYIAIEQSDARRYIWSVATSWDDKCFGFHIWQS